MTTIMLALIANDDGNKDSDDVGAEPFRHGCHIQ